MGSPTKIHSTESDEVCSVVPLVQPCTASGSYTEISTAASSSSVVDDHGDQRATMDAAEQDVPVAFLDDVHDDMVLEQRTVLVLAAPTEASLLGADDVQRWVAVADAPGGWTRHGRSGPHPSGG
jgi:hypothetical protein